MVRDRKALSTWRLKYFLRHHTPWARSGAQASWLALISIVTDPKAPESAPRSRRRHLFSAAICSGSVSFRECGFSRGKLAAIMGILLVAERDNSKGDSVLVGKDCHSTWELNHAVSET